MKKITAAQVVYCAVFFAVCAFFSLGMLIPGASNAAEGASRPALVEDGKLDSDFGSEFETWFSRSFAYRSYVVDAFASLRENVFHTGNEQVIVGEDNFLFFMESLADFEGSDPMTDEELIAAADALKTLSDYTEGHNLPFLFVCAPNKNTIYPEKMPARYRQDPGESNLDRLYLLLDERNVPYLDLRPVLTEAKANALVYHKRDTHWNGLGAHIAAAAIFERLGVTAPECGDYTVSHDFEGDLDGLLYPGVKRYDEEFTYPLDQYVYTSVYHTPMDMNIETRGGAESLGLIIFRDSFGNALIPELASAFSTVSFRRAVPYRLEFSDKVLMRAVIVEIAERNLRTLIGSDEYVKNLPDDRR